ncbi:hypothetical protein ACN47E_005485 [Coniothyrium glycines]
MSETADDLRRYLILPPKAPSGMTHSSPAALSTLGTEISADKNTLSSWLRAKDNSVMEIDQPQHPYPLHAMGGNEDLAQHGIFKLDDYLATNKDIQEASQRAKEAARPPQPKKMKTVQTPASLTPVSIGAHSSRNTVALNDRYQALGIAQPHFTFQGRSDLGWTVNIQFPGLEHIPELQNLPSQGKFNSKAEAKEAMSRTALELLNTLEQSGTITPTSKSKKHALEAASSEQQAGQPPKEPPENYIGQLIEFSRATDTPQATYTDYAHGTRFACLVHIDGHDEPFGSLQDLHGSKKAARQAAAAHAIQHFKDGGTWPAHFTSLGGIRKRKPAAPVAAPSTDVPLPAGAETSTPASSSSSSSSYASRVAALATQLSLGTPQYTFTPHPSAPAFHSVSCTFTHSGGPPSAPLGEVRNVFGKKKAKEECARLVLAHLDEVKRGRVEWGQRIMRGVVGGHDAAGGSVRRAGPGDDEDDDMFEDAVEQMAC